MKDLLRKWSLEKVRFILEHVEDFIESESTQLREAAQSFEAQTDLNTVESLFDGDPNNPRLPQILFQRLSAYFDVGLLLQRSPGPENSNWFATDCMWKGIVFHLELKDQIQATQIVPELTPLQVQKADAKKVMDSLRLGFFIKDVKGDAYLIKPTPHVAYLLISQLPNPWSMQHLEKARILINKCFIY